MRIQKKRRRRPLPKGVIIRRSTAKSARSGRELAARLLEAQRKEDEAARPRLEAAEKEERQRREGRKAAAQAEEERKLILEVLCKCARPLTPGQIVPGLGMSLNVVKHHLRALVDQQAVAYHRPFRYGDDGEYSVLIGAYGTASIKDQVMALLRGRPGYPMLVTEIASRLSLQRAEVLEALEKLKSEPGFVVDVRWEESASAVYRRGA